MKHFFEDFKLTRRSFDHMTSDREYVDMIASTSNDIQMVSGRQNLAQAIINRLLTRKGELAQLGHPNYGSRLYELVGELNNLRIRAKAEIFIRECLDQERRIKEVTNVTIAPFSTQDRGLLKVGISVQPADGSEIISLTLPINLGG